MIDRAVIFTTDKGYLIPTLVAAEQVAAQPKVTAVADILIFLIGIPPSDIALLETRTAGGPVRFIEMPESAFNLPQDVHFEQSHVPKTTLARFLTPQLIPARYRHIIYLDGDIQIVGDIQPLISHDVAPGNILAANDQMFLRKAFLGSAGRYWRRHAAYLAAIGLSEGRQYFNAGILAAERKTWSNICDAGLRYFLENSAKCTYHDQSALNATNVNSREILSPKFNYIMPYMQLGMDRSDVRIIHFTGGVKPWKAHGSFPWPEALTKPYKDIFAKYPELRPYAIGWDNDPGTEPKARLRRVISEAIFDMIKRRRFAAYMRSTPFAVS